ncbi:MAG: mechanosensitive ion channel [Ignavibacteria bacterium]|jgi:small-conductance mechanosensitive channel|nr:mechanosensitive ion channel [Ignavibacteria bacterium]
MKDIFTKTVIAALLLFLIFTAESFSQASLFTQNKPEKKDEKNADTSAVSKLRTEDFGITSAKSPAEWIQKAGLIVNEQFIKVVHKFDTTKWSADYTRLESETDALLAEVMRTSQLNISLKEIKDYDSRAQGLKHDLEKYGEEIKGKLTEIINRYTVLSLINQESFEKTIGKDSVLKTTFLDEYKDIKESADTLRARNLLHIKNLTVRENKRIESSIKLAYALEVIKQKSVQWHLNVFKQNQPPFWSMFGTEYASFGAVAVSSFNFVYNSLANYFRNAWKPYLMFKLSLIIVIVGILFYLRHFRLRKKLDDYKDLELEYINDYPWLIMLLSLLVLVYFAFAYPPVILTQLMLLIIMLIVSYIMFSKYIDRKYLLTFAVIFVYYILVKINDFILEPTIQARIFYFLSIVPAVLLVKAFIDFSKKPFGNSAFIKSMMIFLFVHLIAGFILSLIGYVNLGKVILSGGIRSFFMGIFLTIAVYALLDYIYLVSYYFDRLNTSLKLDLNRVKSKLIWLLIFFASAIWMMQYLREMNTFAYFSESLDAFLNEDRSIGSATFSIGTVLLFPFILFLSFYVSGMINQVVEVSDTGGKKNKRSNTGGVLLLLRLLIVAFGFLAAIAVTGLPLDKLTILVSALGVGIGFGLQNIINNLVSGIIIAVERPFRVGDLVSFGGVDGTVKIIGFRSSVITSVQGSDLIIPNGELISKNLINWTSNNNLRRDNLNIEINSLIRDEDFIKVIRETVQNSEAGTEITGLEISILSYTGMLQKWEINFWVTDIARHAYIKSRMMQSIFRKLREMEVEVTSFN